MEFYDQYRARVQQRLRDLERKMADGLPDEQYREHVGRHKEGLRLLDEFDRVVKEYFEEK